MADPRLGRLFLDLASPEAWLAAERALVTLPFAAEWVPVDLGAPAYRCEQEIQARFEDVGRRARAHGLLPFTPPPAWPFDARRANLAATFAKGGGRSVAFLQAAFRQAYAGGRDLSHDDWIVVAAAACELHPAAVLKGLALRGTATRLDAATDAARVLGIAEAPAVLTPDGEVFTGDAGLELAAAAASGRGG